MIIFLNPTRGADLPVTLTTAKRAAEIVAVDIARMSKKKDAAVTAFLQVRAKTGMLLEHGTKIPIV